MTDEWDIPPSTDGTSLLGKFREWDIPPVVVLLLNPPVMNRI
jgi:hypothetical protein